MVKHRDLNAVQDLLAGRLSAVVLNLVALRELREEDGNQHIECCWYDKSDDLSYDHSRQFDCAWFVCCSSMVPGGLQLGVKIHGSLVSEKSMIRGFDFFRMPLAC